MPAFADLPLIEPLQRAVAAAGYTEPTPIQAQAIPVLVEGQDVIGCARTGTGKTAAFSLPVLQLLTEEPSKRRRIRALILSPTRELAAQIQASFEAYGRYLPLKSTVIFGGVKQGRQVQVLNAGIDILVATPGRLLDLMGQGIINLGAVEFFVLDEADRMLDMGFIRDIRRVISQLPPERQSLLFSATMPPPIAELAKEFLFEPVRIDADPPSSTVREIHESVMFVAKADKRRLLAHLLKTIDVEQAIVFTRTKHGANRLVKQLDREGLVAAAIHGNKSQNARNRALNGFRDGSIPVLVATDIASRGIDVEAVSHVFNFDLPNEPESYVHRIGRTGRAGRAGTAIAFCDDSEGEYLQQIEKLTGTPIERVEEQPYHLPEAVVAPPRASGERRRGRSAEAPSSSSRRRRRRRKPAGEAGGQGAPAQRSPSASASVPAERAGPSPADGDAPTRSRRRRRRRGPRSEGAGAQASAGRGDSERASRPAADATTPRAPRTGADGQAAGEGRRRRRRRRRGPKPAPTDG